MFGFLKHAAGAVDAYATGKAFEQWYKIAEFTTLMYVQQLWDDPDDPHARNLSVCVWSYLFCTEPSAELLAFREHHKGEIQDIALQIIDDDEPFREVIVSTMWVALGVCKSQNDRAGYDRILGSTILKKYFQQYPMLSHEKYAALVEAWAREYSPPPPAASL